MHPVQDKASQFNALPTQVNAVLETTNKNVKKIIAKATKTYRDYHEKLPFALHAYRTGVRTSTGATPYSLVYGIEVVFAYRSGNSFSTSTQRSRIRRS